MFVDDQEVGLAGVDLAEDGARPPGFGVPVNVGGGLGEHVVERVLDRLGDDGEVVAFECDGGGESVFGQAGLDSGDGALQAAGG